VGCIGNPHIRDSLFVGDCCYKFLEPLRDHWDCGDAHSFQGHCMADDRR
jgi:hypothetical protein